MFTGIVTAQGSVAGIALEGDRLKLTINAPYKDLVLGESIAVNGACLTVMERGAGNFSVEAVVTTRERTTLAALKIGSRVNLERAVAVGSRMGGHFVQGHVDGVAEVIRVTRREDAVLIDLRPPDRHPFGDGASRVDCTRRCEHDGERATGTGGGTSVGGAVHVRTHDAGVARGRRSGACGGRHAREIRETAARDARDSFNRWLREHRLT